MSQFHWHVVDAQSFPLTIPGFPELSQQGAYSTQEVYSSSDIEDIVNYAGVVRRPFSYKKKVTPKPLTLFFLSGELMCLW
jgi:glycosyl hydrolase family 20